MVSNVFVTRTLPSSTATTVGHGHRGDEVEASSPACVTFSDRLARRGARPHAGFSVGWAAVAASSARQLTLGDLAMAWDFCTDPDVQARLDWADRFVTEEIEPIESLLYDVVDVGRPQGAIAALFEQWRQEVKDQNLYAAHLPVAQGGQGFGEVNLALLNEVIG